MGYTSESNSIDGTKCPQCQSQNVEYEGMSLDVPRRYVFKDMASGAIREYAADLFHCRYCDYEYSIEFVNRVVKYARFDHLTFPALSWEKFAELNMKAKFNV